MRGPAKIRPVHLAPPLADLRQRWRYLEIMRSLGAALRADLIKEGCAVWSACQDLHWAEWISRYGDETARDFVRTLYEAALERKTEIDAKAKADLAP